MLQNFKRCNNVKLIHHVMTDNKLHWYHTLCPLYISNSINSFKIVSRTWFYPHETGLSHLSCISWNFPKAVTNCLSVLKIFIHIYIITYSVIPLFYRFYKFKCFFIKGAAKPIHHRYDVWIPWHWLKLRNVTFCFLSINLCFFLFHLCRPRHMF